MGTGTVGCGVILANWTDGYRLHICKWWHPGCVASISCTLPFDVKSFNLFTDSFNGSSRRDDSSFSSLDNTTAPIALAFARLSYSRLRGHSLPASFIPDFIITDPARHN